MRPSVVLIGVISACTAGGNNNTHTLTVSLLGAGTVMSSPNGINCHGSGCVAEFPAGSVVMLAATPDTNATFDSWAGGCSGTFPGCTVTLDQDVEVDATFTGSTS